MNGVRPLVAGTAQEAMYRGDRAVVVCSYYFRYYHLPSIASLLFLSGSETVNRFYSVTWLDSRFSVGASPKHQRRENAQRERLSVRRLIGQRSLHNWYLPP